jgi:hypothetical protein
MDFRISVAIRKMLSNAGKTSDEVPPSYPRSGVVSKIRPGGRLDCVCTEAATGKIQGSSRPMAPLACDPASALVLRLDVLECALYHVCTDASARQVVADGRVPVAARRHVRRPTRCEAHVVDEPGGPERRDGLLNDGLVEPALLQTLPQLAGREVAGPQRPGRSRQRFGAPQFAADGPQGRAVERPPFGERGADDDIDR